MMKELTPEMLIFIAGIFSLFLIGFTLVVVQMINALNGKNEEEINQESVNEN